MPNLIQRLLAPFTRVSLRYEPPNVSSSATVATVQSAIRAAEGGNTRELFALYRDAILGGSHAQSEFGKRKMPVLSEPHSVQPADKENDDDVKAAEACAWMIDHCGNWLDGLTHALDATLWPVAVTEKIFEPARENTLGLRFGLKCFAPVNHTLLCFRPRYETMTGLTPDPRGERWESDLRLYRTDANGGIVWNEEDAYPKSGEEVEEFPRRLMIHRGHLLVSVRDNYGGPMRAVLFWWLLGTLGRDWFARYMERYGSPWPIAKTDSEDAAAVTFLKDALALSTKVGGLVVDNDTEVQLAEAMTANAADAYERFLNVCNREQSKIILGQTLSATADPTGLGSGTSNLHGEVREDMMRFDRRKLGETIRQQLFEPFLRMNGFTGAAPRIVWGGLSVADAKQHGELLVSLNNAGLEPVDEALPTISERVGFPVQRKVAPPPSPGLGGFGGAQLSMFSAGLPSFATAPSDAIARERAAALARAFRADLADVPRVLALSASPEDFLEKLAQHFKTWKPGKVAAVAEEALQLCAASGAGAATGRKS